MKKLMFVIPALAIFASCTNPKSEVRKDLMGSEISEAKTDTVHTVVIQEVYVKEVGDNGATIASSSTASKPEVAAKSGKRKWSNKEKGAVIGAASGAVAGAVVSEKRVKGAVIGGVIGGGVGLGTGAIFDHNEKKKGKN